MNILLKLQVIIVLIWEKVEECSWTNYRANNKTNKEKSDINENSETKTAQIPLNNYYTNNS